MVFEVMKDCLVIATIMIAFACYLGVGMYVFRKADEESVQYAQWALSLVLWPLTLVALMMLFLIKGIERGEG